MGSTFVNGMEVHGVRMPSGLLERLTALLDAHGLDARVVCVRLDDNAWRPQGADVAALAVPAGLNPKGVSAMAYRQAVHAKELGLRVALVGADRRGLSEALQALCDWVVY